MGYDMVAGPHLKQPPPAALIINTLTTSSSSSTTRYNQPRMLQKVRRGPTSSDNHLNGPMRL